MSNSQPTLANFFSQNNVKLLYDLLRQSMKESLHYNMSGDEYMLLLTDIMQRKVKALQGRVPSDVTTLNKDTLKDAIPLFIKNIRERDESRQQQQRQQQRPVQIPTQPTATQYQSSQGTSQGMEHLFNQLIDQRAPTQGPKNTPNFQDPTPQDQPNVNQIYQLEDQRRKQSDLIPPPDPRSLSMLPPNIANNIRPQPTMYDDQQQHQQQPQQHQQQEEYYRQQQYQHQAQQQQQHRQYNNVNNLGNGYRDARDGYYPQDFNIASSFVPSPPPNNNIPQDYNFENQLPSVNNYEAPQPSQMRVLIPEVSRGTKTVSDLIPQVFTVDSRDRDDNSYPDPSNYRIRLPEFKNVISIELVAAEVPVTGYVINETNNILHFQEDAGITLQAIIPIGNYTPDDLASAIEMAMTNLTGYGVTYDVINTTLTNTFTIAAMGGPSPVFNLIFFGGTIPYTSANEPNPTDRSIYEPLSIGSTIGFDKVDLTGNTTYTGQFRYNLGGEKNLYLHIEEADLILSTDSNVHKSFAKIPLNVPLGGTAFYQRNEDYPYIKYYSSDIGRLSHLTIQWKTHDGAFYNFNGNNHNHVLTFEIISKDNTKPPY
jgi:hypothetical protein